MDAFKAQLSLEIICRKRISQRAVQGRAAHGNDCQPPWHILRRARTHAHMYVHTHARAQRGGNLLTVDFEMMSVFEIATLLDGTVSVHWKEALHAGSSQHGKHRRASVASNWVHARYLPSNMRREGGG